jgi:hypothetical protein
LYGRAGRAGRLTAENGGFRPGQIDNDKTWFHSNFNGALSKMMSDHKGDLVFESAPGYCSTDGNCSQVGSYPIVTPSEARAENK